MGIKGKLGEKRQAWGEKANLGIKGEYRVATICIQSNFSVYTVEVWYLYRVVKGKIQSSFSDYTVRVHTGLVTMGMYTE